MHPYHTAGFPGPCGPLKIRFAMETLVRSFYARDSRRVARNLLGQHLVRTLKGLRLSGRIVETEAYLGPQDSASHAYRGQTPRNAPMFGPAGVAYVYFVYGRHHMFNVVTGHDGEPGAVLIRSIEPLEGRAEMERRRGKKGPVLTNGPGKLCQALGVDRSLSGWDLTIGQKIWLEKGDPLPDREVLSGPRVGIAYATAKDRMAHWRFMLKNDC